MTASDARLRPPAERWRTEGWTVIDGLIERSVVDDALDELNRLGPERIGVASTSRPRYREVPDDGPGFRPQQFTGTHPFPLPDCPTLNRLFVHPEVVRFAQLALGSDDIRLYQSRTWSKFGGRTNYEQAMHQDLNHSLVPTRSEEGWWHVELFVYLTDVDDRNGALRLVPRPHDPAIDPPPSRSIGPGDAPHLYAEEITVPGPAGTLVAYRSDVWHRGSDLEPGTERHLMVLGFKPASVEWIDYDTLPPLSINDDFITLVEQCGPDELALFGFPPPGHAYWTPVQLEATARRYPGLDLGPWWESLD